MIIYLSMIIWVLLMWFFISSTKTKYANSISNPPLVTPIIAWITFSYIFFWISMRTAFADTEAYIESFSNAPSLIEYNSLAQEGKGQGFTLMEVLFKDLISSNYHIWLTFITLLCGIPIVKHLRVNSFDFFMSAYLFVVSLNFTWMMNGIRQFIPAAIMFGLYKMILNKKMFLYIIVILLLSKIHFSVIIMIPMYWCITSKPFSRPIMLFVCSLIMIVVFLSPFLEVLETSLTGTGYEKNLEQFAEDDGANPLRVVFAAIPSIIAFIYRKKLFALNNSYINMSVNMSLIGAGIYFVAVFTSGIMVGRLPIYFELYNLTLIPFLLKQVVDQSQRNIITIGYMALYFVFFYLQASKFWYVSDLTGPIVP